MTNPDAGVCPCNGTGAVVTKTEDHGGCTTIMTYLCKCRRDLPRRDGKVAWWSCDTPKVWEWSDGAEWAHVTVTATRELPISEDNYPLRRTADNTYLCASVRLEMDGNEFPTPEHFRAFANWLLKVADEIDQYDEVAP